MAQTNQKTTNKTGSSTTAASGNNASDNASLNGTATTATSSDNSSAMDKKTPLRKLFIDGLKDMLWAEQAIIEGLKKMQAAASDENLSEAFEDHEIETRKHISRLEKVLTSIGEKIEPKKCDAMEGILKEAEETMKSTPESSATRDAALILGAQKVEHYEIASYGGLVAMAHTLELKRATKLLEQTLEEEEDTDSLLTEIAEEYINFEAEQEDDTSEEDEDA
jgi:ferritin-like metal-binding protein YciE